MADGDPPPWADLATDIVREIASRHLCELDRLRAEALCRSWRAALLPLGPAPPPPPSRGSSSREPAGLPACLPLRPQQQAHPPLLHPARRTRRASYDSAWIFLSVRQADHHLLVSLHNYGASIGLPNALRPRIVVRQFPQPPILVERRIVIVAATLSRQPTEQGCVAAGIICFHRSPHDPRQIAFWRMGEQAISGSFPPMNPELGVEDLLYSHGAFHFLTRGEHIRRFHQRGPRRGDPRRYGVTAKLYFQRRGDDDGVTADTRTPQPRPSPTSAFQVFRREDRDVINDDGEVQAEHSWTELPTLDGRLLFVGRGCSRSYDEPNG
ncbi:hypothetical protein E2562_025350 [Oryza meyeriana var. granulata]|uniref:KIB1-4 beta-propeller domain-containing protein n=1 Tax=Oryza meyeriana var. granulata TaxID=110450 RepID=A0A6G1DM77_9ORYZ|nr:hypothetical protein E2562_025350 [Oryza meyeriana var. granulata]